MANIIIQQTIPVLFKKILQSKITGELYVRLEGHEKKLFFDNGTLLSACSNFTEDRLGNILFKMGKLNEEQLEKIAIIVKQKKPQDKIGRLLVQHKMLTRKDIFEGLKEQVSSIAVSLFTLTSGEWGFRSQIPEIPADSQFKIKLPDIICKGIKKIDNIPFLANEFHYKAPKTNTIPPTVDKYLSPADIKLFKALSTFHDVPIKKILRKLNLPEETFWRKINLFYILNILDFDEISGTLEDTAVHMNIDITNIVSELNQFYSDIQGGKKSYYEILGVDENAETKKIKENYLELKKRFDPNTIRLTAELHDRARFVSAQLTKVFETLGDKKKREEYNLQKNQHVDIEKEEEIGQPLAFDLTGELKLPSPTHQATPRRTLFSSPLEVTPPPPVDPLEVTQVETFDEPAEQLEEEPIYELPAEPLPGPIPERLPEPETLPEPEQEEEPELLTNPLPEAPPETPPEPLTEPEPGLLPEPMPGPGTGPPEPLPDEVFPGPLPGSEAEPEDAPLELQLQSASLNAAPVSPPEDVPAPIPGANVNENAEEPPAIQEVPSFPGNPAATVSENEPGPVEQDMGVEEESGGSLFGSMDDFMSEPEPEPELDENLPDEEKQKIAKEKFEKAENLYKKKKYMEAALLLEKVVQFGIKEFSFLFLLGLSQMEIPLLRKKAEQSLLEAAEIEPQNAEPLYALGLLYKSEDMAKKAEAYFRKALEVNVEHALAEQMLKKIEADNEKENIPQKKKSFFSIFSKK